MGRPKKIKTKINIKHHLTQTQDNLSLYIYVYINIYIYIYLFQPKFGVQKGKEKVRGRGTDRKETEKREKFRGCHKEVR